MIDVIESWVRKIAWVYCDDPVTFWVISGLIFLAVIALVFIVWLVWFQTSHTCTQWGPYYQSFVPITTGKTTIMVPHQVRDCIGKWVPNR